MKILAKWQVIVKLLLGDKGDSMSECNRYYIMKEGKNVQNNTLRNYCNEKLLI